MTNHELMLQTAPSPTYNLATSKNYVLKTAGFWVRFWAFLLDILIIAAIGGIIINPIFYLMDWSLSQSAWYAPISILSAILYYSYFVLMTKFFGQTIGKMALGLRVISLKHEQLTWSDVLFRDWIGRVISNIFKPLYLLTVVMPNNQGLHDFFADTAVVHENVYIEKELISTPAVEPNQSLALEKIESTEEVEIVSESTDK
ncbi:RDD family protein [Lysinibacillus piscis]|uniref:RDD domain-containing protein n=1 Tax=Lysinibacillus piscis TaxID=2518931 RepID=A0ABQ5NJ25_9BACI|nr:RDD family protein [Lysinibacillus sp. KH24]GLC88289.1 hypothetical protein LYSBPC_14160 [Lysinibacillus sp. KH24]